jgi:TetR/AcrR family transcriptional regulator
MTSKSTTSRLPTEARQGEIVAAALRLAETNSPAAITTTELAEAVGLSQGALFKHFPNKEAVWLGAMQWLVDNLMRTLTQAAQTADTPIDALHKVFEAHVEFVSRHPGVPRLIFHVLQQPGLADLKSLAREMMQQYRAMVRQLLHQAIDCGDIAADLDLDAASTMFLGQLQGLVMQSLMTGHSATMLRQAPAVFELFQRALRLQP